MLFYAVPSAGLLFRGGETIPKIFLGLVMLTLLTHLCWRWALARVVLPLRAESSSSLVFKGGCSWPGLHCVGSFPGIQLMKFGFFFKSFLFIIYDLTVNWNVWVSQKYNVCVLPFLKSEVWEWNQKWLPKNASKYIFSLLPFCPSAVAEVEQCGLELGKALVLQFGFDGRGLSCWSFWKCLSFVYVKKYCASYLSLPFLSPSLNGPI